MPLAHKKISDDRWVGTETTENPHELIKVVCLQFRRDASYFLVDVVPLCSQQALKRPADSDSAAIRGPDVARPIVSTAESRANASPKAHTRHWPFRGDPAPALA